MTKHVSPDELICTDYIRAVDGAIETMVEVTCGRFVCSHHASAKRHVANDNVDFQTTKEVRPKKGLTEFERLLEANTESPKNVSLQFVQKNLEKLFEPDETSYVEQDGAISSMASGELGPSRDVIERYRNRLGGTSQSLKRRK